MKPHSGGHTAAAREQALKEAEDNLVRPGEADAKDVLVRLDELRTYPVLFQPRSFLSARVGDREEVDEDWVKKFKHRIATSGELDPLTVVRLRVWSEPDVYTKQRTLLPLAWIIVDGHHRRAAYQAMGWKEPLRCVWFAGSAREAMDAAGRSSTVLKLEASREDREEECWKRLLMKGWTREELRKQFHVSPNLITHMNKVIHWFRDKSVRTKRAREFRRLHTDLKDVSWYEARLAYLGATPKERTEEQQVQALARRLRERFPPSGNHSLSRDAKITAGALSRYDRRLPEALAEEWAVEPSEAIRAFRDAEAHADLEDAGAASSAAPTNGSAWDGLTAVEELQDDLRGEMVHVEEGPRSVQGRGGIRYRISLSACECSHFSALKGPAGDNNSLVETAPWRLWQVEHPPAALGP